MTFNPDQYRKRNKYTSRPDNGYDEVRKKCLKRDKHRCQMCGSKRKIEVHHIIRYADSKYLRCEISNLVSVCTICHKKVTGREIHYVKFFQEIVKRNEKRT